MNYTVIVQSVEEMQNIQKAPSISMGEYLVFSGYPLFTTLGIYSLRGSNRELVRLLYINATARSIWIAMGITPTVIGSMHRPPREVFLTPGVPFRE
jgi:hypothetical protein